MPEKEERLVRFEVESIQRMDDTEATESIGTTLYLS